jgi:hypothetical protein
MQPTNKMTTELTTTTTKPEFFDEFYVQEMKDLHKAYTEQQLELKEKFKDEELTKETEKLNSWHDFEKQKLKIRTTVREKAKEIEEVFDYSTDTLTTAWESLKESVTNYFYPIDPAKKQWDDEAEDVNYLENVKKDLEYQRIRDLVHAQITHVIGEKKDAKK